MNISITKCSHSSQVNFRGKSKFVHGLKRPLSTLLAVVLLLRLFLHSALDLQVVFLDQIKRCRLKVNGRKRIVSRSLHRDAAFFCKRKGVLRGLFCFLFFWRDGSEEWGECQVVCTTDFIKQSCCTLGPKK